MIIMRLQPQNNATRLAGLFLFLCATAVVATAQTTGFTYQGRLTDGGTAANGSYDLQFTLFDSASGGAQVGSTQTISSVAVSAGVFTVQLDFGATAFPGASRFLEISARPSGAGTFTLLSPRQPITSTPYAVRSLNAATADSVPASGVPAGSGNYIQNGASPQAASNFNISGNGTAGGTLSGNAVNATTQYNLNGTRILSNPGTQNLFAGDSAGASNTTGIANAFFGKSAGGQNSTGDGNAFFGVGAGALNTTGIGNVIIGDNAEVGAGNLTNAIAIGHLARVDSSNALVLGSISGINGGTDTNVGIGTTTPATRLHVVGITGLIGLVGIGTTNPLALLHVNDGGGHILFTRGGCIAPFAGIMFAAAVVGSCTNYALLGGDGNTYLNRPTGGSITLREGNVEQVLIQAGGNTIFVKTVQLNTLGTAGGSALCRNAAFQIAFCSSSRRYKTGVEPFAGGLQLVNRLQPVSFLWKANRQPDIGLIAEDVAQVEPLLTFKNQNGDIEGVNYSQVSVVLINAIKEQQAQIQQQRELIERQRALAEQQQQQLNALKKLACRSHRRAGVCK
jgi:hypothetical protein